MRMTEDEKKRLTELDRRKRKILEEEQTRLNDFNADQRRLLIFSHIFQMVPRLKRLSKRTSQKLKRRTISFNQKGVDENKARYVQDIQAGKDKHQQSNIHLNLFHHDKSYRMQKSVPEEILQSYVKNLKKRI